jgi:hypothetical protein
MPIRLKSGRQSTISATVTRIHGGRMLSSLPMFKKGSVGRSSASGEWYEHYLGSGWGSTTPGFQLARLTWVFVDIFNQQQTFLRPAKWFSCGYLDSPPFKNYTWPLHSIYSTSHVSLKPHSHIYSDWEGRWPAHTHKTHLYHNIAWKAPFAIALTPPISFTHGKHPGSEKSWVVVERPWALTQNTMVLVLVSQNFDVELALEHHRDRSNGQWLLSWAISMIKLVEELKSREVASLYHCSHTNQRHLE